MAFPPEQYTSSQLHPFHRLFDQDGHQDSSSLSLYLDPCEFWLFPKLTGYRYETMEEMKEAATKVIDTLTQEDFHGGLPEVVGTVQEVHCSRGRLLRRRLEFYVCTINKSAHTKKVWKPIVCTSYVIVILAFCNHFIFFLMLLFTPRSSRSFRNDYRGTNKTPSQALEMLLQVYGDVCSICHCLPPDRT